jgi:hypothetical protein
MALSLGIEELPGIIESRVSTAFWTKELGAVTAFVTGIRARNTGPAAAISRPLGFSL